MKALSQFTFIFVTVMLSGCGGRLMVVHRTATPSTPPASEVEVSGIPFYVKTAGCKHQTVWLQPIYTLTLKKTFTPDKPSDKPQPDKPSDKPQPGKPTDKPQQEIRVYVAVLALTPYRNPAVAALRALLSGSEQPTPPEVMDAWNRVQSIGVPDPYTVDEDELSGTDSTKVIRVANQTSVEKYVDYATTYYYNTNKPLAGTAQASFKLGDEGTMSEGSAQVESKTIATFLSLLPVSDVLSKVAAAYLPKTKTLLEAFPPGTFKFELSTETRIFKHAHEAFLRDAKGVALKPPCPAKEDDVDAPYNLTVEDVTEGKKETSDGSTVKVNGSIVLPKTEEKKK